jgi:hypothetical protein
MEPLEQPPALPGAQATGPTSEPLTAPLGDDLVGSLSSHDDPAPEETFPASGVASGLGRHFRRRV